MCALWKYSQLALHVMRRAQSVYLLMISFNATRVADDGDKARGGRGAKRSKVDKTQRRNVSHVFLALYRHPASGGSEVTVVHRSDRTITYARRFRTTPVAADTQRSDVSASLISAVRFCFPLEKAACTQAYVAPVLSNGARFYRVSLIIY